MLSHFLSLIYEAIDEAVCFQFTYSSFYDYDNISNIIFLSSSSRRKHKSLATVWGQVIKQQHYMSRHVLTDE